MGKYTHYFDSESAYTESRENNYLEPWVSYTEGKGVDYNKVVNANGHPYVDLGLPSGTLWATCNVGAISPEDYGGYFAWGETSEKTGSSAYSYNDYVYGPYDFGQFPDFGLTKYNNIDELIELESSDDVATVVMGGGWHTPHIDQWLELINNTTATSTTINGVFGTQLTSVNNGNTLFFPYAGYKESINGGREATELYDEGSYVSLWASTVNEEEPGRVWSFSSSPDEWWEGEKINEFYAETNNESFRYYGCSVRGVIG